MSVTSARPRPDQPAFEKVTRLDFPVVVKEVRELLGPKLVAYIAGVAETRAVHEWADGIREPRAQVEPRVRLALILAQTIADRDDSGVARAWFQGLNPHLEDRSPARLLREGDLDDVGPQLIGALRAFIIGG